MKTILIYIQLAAFLFISQLSKAQDYRIQIADTAFDISLGKKYEIPVSGKKISCTVTRHDTLVYDDSLFSFKYSKDYKVSRHAIQDDIVQFTILTAEGNGFILQKYTSLDPTSLNSVMMSEMTKESKSYGYKSEKKDYTRKLVSGQSTTVNKEVLTYKDNTYVYEVASFGKKDEGILIVTMILSESSDEGTRLIDLLWNSLVIK
jgi:hypothetical protein